MKKDKWRAVREEAKSNKILTSFDKTQPTSHDPGELFGLIFTRYVQRGFQGPYPIIVYSVANYRPYL